MSTALMLCLDFSTDAAQHLAWAYRYAGQSQRLLALAIIYDSRRRMEASRLGAAGPHTMRDFVLVNDNEVLVLLVDGKPLNRVIEQTWKFTFKQFYEMAC